MAKAKAETVQKSSDGWAFMHPTTREWTGQYKTRVAARAARAAVVKETGDSDDDGEAQTITSADVAEVSADQLVDQGTKKEVDTPARAHVDSSTSEQTSNEATSIVNTGGVAHSEQDKKIMATISLTLDPKTRKSTSVVFKLPAGVRGSVRIAKTAFPNGVPPASLSLQSDQENAFAEAKAKLTAEQRKQARKDAPKLSPAQKLAKLQERAAKLQAKIAAEATPAAPATA